MTPATLPQPESAVRALTVLRILVVPILLLSATTQAATITVGLSGDHATIQAAVNAAGEGDEVVVSPGTYVENVQLTGVDFTLRSTDPSNSSIVETTIIDGSQAETVIVLEGSETKDFVLEGLTIQNGKGRGGGVRGNHSKAVIRNNRIINNTAAQQGGGGLKGCDGLIQGNLIANNDTLCSDGGGIIDGLGPIVDNVIVGNISRSYLDGGEGTGSGGGLDCTTSSGVLIARNLFAGNVAYTGGAITCEEEAHIQNNVFYGNYAHTSGGAINGAGDSLVVNNTFVRNEAGSLGGAIAGVQVNQGVSRIANNIFWYNTAPQDSDLSGNGVPPEYCCLSADIPGAVNCFVADPCFVDEANGDFHLKLESPCIDAGCLVGEVTDDFDGAPRPIAGLHPSRGDGSGYDIGADEFLSGDDLVYLRTNISGNGRIDPVTGLTILVPGSSMRLTAVPADGWAFQCWTGDAAGSQNPIVVNMNSNKVVQAVFLSLEEPLLYTAVQGKGSIYPPPGTYSYIPGAQVTLTAIPASGWEFTAWAGDIVGSPNPVTLTLNEYTTAIATFTETSSDSVECPAGAISPKTDAPCLITTILVLALFFAAAKSYGHWRKHRRPYDKTPQRPDALTHRRPRSRRAGHIAGRTGLPAGKVG